MIQKGHIKEYLRKCLRGFLEEKTIAWALAIHCGNLLLTCHDGLWVTLGISGVWIHGKTKCFSREKVDDGT